VRRVGDLGRKAQPVALRSCHEHTPAEESSVTDSPWISYSPTWPPPSPSGGASRPFKGVAAAAAPTNMAIDKKRIVNGRRYIQSEDSCLETRSMHVYVPDVAHEACRTSFVLEQEGDTKETNERAQSGCCPSRLLTCRRPLITGNRAGSTASEFAVPPTSPGSKVFPEILARLDD